MSELISADSIVIELTRRCNLSCDHCMRGEPESIDIADSTLEALFSRVERIGSLSLTGGEPSLVPDRIYKIIELIKRYRVDVSSFYIATNAFQITDDFIRVCMELYLACTDNEVSQVHISNSPYHINGGIAVERLMLLKFVSYKYDDKTLQRFGDALIRQGRSGTGRANDVDNFDVNGKEVSNGDLYLNCYGDIIAGCDFSFETQRSDRNCFICKVENLSARVIENWQRSTSDE